MSRAREIFDQALAYLPGGNTRSTLFVAPHPPYASSGAGYEVTDENGHRVIDMAGNASVLVHGHGHPDVIEAAAKAIRRGSCFSLPTQLEIELARLLVERIPSIDQVRFTSTGTEAVMMAIRAARALTGRRRIVRFRDCYHGAYDDVAYDASSAPALRSDSVVLELGDKQTLTSTLDQLESEVSCVILDLMSNRAGLVPVDPEFAQLIRSETERRGIVLIVDEVITLRLAVGGLQSEYGLLPDLTTFGKVVGGGFPIGGFGGRAEIMALFDPRREGFVSHAGTFSANPVSMAAGRTAVTLLDDATIARINGLGDRLRSGLTELGFRATGRGSLLRVQSDDPPQELWRRLYAGGVLTMGNGMCAVSSVMDEGVIDRVLDVYAGARQESDGEGI